MRKTQEDFVFEGPDGPEVHYQALEAWQYEGRFLWTAHGTDGEEIDFRTDTTDRDEAWTKLSLIMQLAYEPSLEIFSYDIVEPEVQVFTALWPWSQP